MFSLFRRKKHFFSEVEQQRIVAAVAEAEKRTSGEIRIFVENHCRFLDAFDRATEIFLDLKMHETAERNAVLLYFAMKDHQMAILGDEGIHHKVGSDYWLREAKQIMTDFNKEDYASGIIKCVQDIGEALHQHFPYDSNIDKNELPDEIIFGR